jgi:hypothetical protein
MRLPLYRSNAAMADYATLKGRADRGQYAASRRHRMEIVVAKSECEFLLKAGDHCSHVIAYFEDSLTFACEIK